MRLRIILPVLVLCCAIIGVALQYGPSVSTQNSNAAPGASPVSALEPSASPAHVHGDVTARRTERSAPVAEAPSPMFTESIGAIQAQNEYVQTRIHELNDMAMSGNPADLRSILGELNDPEPRLRSAAVNAAVQFESPDAIPALQDAMTQATELDEKVHIQKAITLLQNATPTGDGTGSTQ